MELIDMNDVTLHRGYTKDTMSKYLEVNTNINEIKEKYVNKWDLV